MKLIIFLALTIASFSTFAKTTEYTKQIVCRFTEPFFTIVYDVDKSELLINEMGEGVRVISKKVKIKKIKSDLFLPSFNLKFKDQKDKVKKSLSLVYNFKGSDGMSDVVYPIDARFVRNNDQRTLWGACETNLIEKFDPHQ